MIPSLRLRGRRKSNEMTVLVENSSRAIRPPNGSLACSRSIILRSTDIVFADRMHDAIEDVCAWPAQTFTGTIAKYIIYTFSW